MKDFRHNHAHRDEPEQSTGAKRLAPGKLALSGLSSAILRKSSGGGTTIPIDGRRLVEEASARPGAALPEPLKRELELALGRSLDGVRLHTDATAAAAARAIGARAFARGQDIYFAAGEFNPRSAEGRQLIAHEVAHTVQSIGGASMAPTLSEPGDHVEREADAFADAFSAGLSKQSDDGEVQPRGESRIARITDERDEQLVQAEMFRRRTLPYMSSRDLVSLASSLDASVMSGEGLGPRSRAARAETLIQIYDILEERNLEAPTGPDARAEADPRNPGRLEDDLLETDSDDPLAGIIDAVEPFGNLDQWRAIASSAPDEPERPSRQRRRRQEPEGEPEPEPEPETPEADPRPPADVDVPAAQEAAEGEPPAGPGPMTGVRTAGFFTLGQIIGAVTAPLAGGIMTLAGLVGNFGGASDRSREQAREAGRRFGVRYGTAALNMSNPPPPQYRRAPIIERVRNMEGGAPYREQVNMSFTPMSPGMMRGWIHGAIGDLVSQVNAAFRQGDQQIAERARAARTAGEHVDPVAERGEMRREVIDELMRMVESAGRRD